MLVIQRSTANEKPVNFGIATVEGAGVGGTARLTNRWGGETLVWLAG
jgi:hypothetical protein